MINPKAPEARTNSIQPSQRLIAVGSLMPRTTPSQTYSRISIDHHW